MDDDYRIEDDFKMTDVDIREVIPYLKLVPEFQDMSKREIYLFLKKEYGDTIKVGPIDEWEMNGEPVYTVGFVVCIPGTDSIKPLLFNFCRRPPWGE